MLSVDHFIDRFSSVFPLQHTLMPWQITTHLPELLQQLLATLDGEYELRDGIAVHRSAVIEEGVVLKAPAVIGPGCFIGACAYLRGGVYLGPSCSVGPHCELKTSLLFAHSAVAHFNFIGDSLIGSRVNFEAGSVTANHFNERHDKRIPVRWQEKIIETGVIKFGALVGDHCRIGANAVLSPGTLLQPGSVVGRLELVDQVGTGYRQ